MSSAKERVMLPKIELIPREEWEQEEIRYMGYYERLHYRQRGTYGK